MTTLLDPRPRLINARHLQLRLEADTRRSRPLRSTLIDKRDGRELASWTTTTPDATRLSRLIDRRSWPELAGLLRRACQDRVRPDAGIGAGIARHAQTLVRDLGFSTDALSDYRLPRCTEPACLMQAGHDLAGRRLWLDADTAGAWPRMRDAARRDGIDLLAVSGYRSVDYQAGLVARKLAHGQPVAEILRFSALPGYSEHHSGRVLDLHDGVGPALEESFERGDAFAWLGANAGRFGFAMSYPRDNPWGIGYEPWHWRLDNSGAN